MAKRGRPVGSKTQTSSAARLKLAKLKCDPVERGVACANILFESEEYDKAGKIYVDLINYIHPKLKAIEISQDNEKPISFNITIGGKK